MAVGDRTEKRLFGPTVIGTTATSIAAVPSNRTWVTKQIVLANTNGVDAWVSLSIGDVGTSTNCFMYQLPISAYDTLVFDTAMVMTQGEAIQAISDRGGITVVANGWEKEVSFSEALQELTAARPLLTDGAYIDGTNGLVLSGLPGNYASTPDSAALSITGDIDIKVKVTMADWTPAATSEFVSKFETSGNQQTFIFRVIATGQLRLSYSSNGSTNTDATSTVATGIADGTTKWVRVTMDVDNGAGSHVVKFYTSDDGSTWAQLGTTVTVAGTTSLFDSTMPVLVGTWRGTNGMLTGTVHRAIIQDAYDTADNTTNVVFDADFEAEAADTLAFTEDSTNAATVSVVTTRYTVGLPGVPFSGVTSVSVTPNTDFYYPFVVTQPVEFDMYTVEVTTGPASAATAYLGIYPTDGDYNPNGNVIAATSFAVGTSETGVFQTQLSPVTLQPGTYVAVLNTSVAFTGRALSASRTNVVHTFGSSPFTLLLYRNRTAATMPTTLSGPDLRVTSSATQRIPMLLRWRPL